MAWIALAIGVTLCGISVVLGFDGRTFLGRPLGADFIEFYTTGKILNHYAPARIYDLQFVTELQHSTLPTMPESEKLAFGYAPFIAPLFRPFALLPYAWAYVAWLGFSAGLFIAGLALLFRTLRLNVEDRKTGFLLALSFTPFLFETWIGGQIPAVAFSIWALFFWCLESDRRIISGFLAGFVLALCLFKPTLVALPGLMLLVGRRWRVVGGLTAGGITVALLSLATVGLEGCRGWLQTLALITAGKTGEAWHQAKYVDILAFFRLLLPNEPLLAAVVSIALGMIAVSWLGWAWWRSETSETNRPLWAATLCFSLVLNAYVPIYDTILVVCAVALLHSVRGAPPGWLAALYVVPWVTQPFAEFLHLQLMTLVVAGFGIWAMEKLVENSPAPWFTRAGGASMIPF